MTNEKKKTGAVPAAERYFRVYWEHCTNPNPDTLYLLLNVLHSLNDKLDSEHGVNFYELKEFQALKALRNYYQHEGEIPNEMRWYDLDGISMISDLSRLCMISHTSADEAIKGAKTKRTTDEDLDSMRSTFKWCGRAVNINPCIFNFTVYVYETVEKLGLELKGDGYEAIKDIYEMEEREGYPHFVTGDVACHASDMDALLAQAFAPVKA